MKLGRALGVEPAELEFLTAVPPEELRRVREALYARLFEQDARVFRRLARLFGWVPMRLASVLAARLHRNPLLLPRFSSELPAARGAELLRRLPVDLVADAMTHADPRRAPDRNRLLPRERVIALVQELVRRRDFLTLGRFNLGPEEHVGAVAAAIDDESLLRVTFFMESRKRNDHLLRQLPPERTRALVLLACDESKNLWPEVLTLLMHVSDGLRRELAGVLAAQDESVLARLAGKTQELGLWSDLLPVIAVMPEPAQRVVANLAALEDPALQRSIVEAADQSDLWDVVLALLGMIDTVRRPAVARILAGQMHSSRTLERAVEAALLGEIWEPLLDVVGHMPAESQRTFVEIVVRLVRVDPELLSRVARSSGERGFGEHFAAHADDAPG